MKIGWECLACFVGQACEAVRFVTHDQRIMERILRQAVFRLANEEFEKTPPSAGEMFTGDNGCHEGDMVIIKKGYIFHCL